VDTIQVLSVVHGGLLVIIALDTRQHQLLTAGAAVTCCLRMLQLPAVFACTAMTGGAGGQQACSEHAAAAHLVSKAPEQHGHHHGAPQLGHHVEQAVCPVAQDGNGASEAGASLLQQVLAERCSTQSSRGSCNC
jgi:hypothetical protein